MDNGRHCVAARAATPALGERHLLRHSGYLLKTTPLSRPKAIECATSRPLAVGRDFCWQLEAWAVFSNHYHFVAHSPPHENGAASLSKMLGVLHEKTAKWVNGLDSMKGRQVWHNFRETLLTFERSYLARLNYVHQNPVKHGLVPVANQYPWCSAAWFERTA